MKFLKIMAVIMAVCMLACSFVACGEKQKEDDTTPETTAKVTITLVIKDAEGKEVGKETVTCNGKLVDAIETYCAIKDYDFSKCFDETSGLLTTIGDVTGSGWKAYYEDEGQNKLFDSIKDADVLDGKTVVLSLK